MLFGAGVFSLTLFLACAAFMRRVPSTMALQVRPAGVLRVCSGASRC